MAVAVASSRPKLANPVGVTVVPDGEEPVARAPEQQRLLRQPRCVPSQSHNCPMT